MSCTSLRGDILSALRTQSEGNIQKARVNVEVYLHHPVGIGEHPDIIAAIQDQLDIIAHEEERITMIDKHFTSHHHN
jgi:hypothetical protein